MKKIFEYIGILSLVCFSFFLTDKTVSVVQEIDFDFSTEYVLKNTEFLPEQNYENYIRNNPNRRKITIKRQ